MLKKEYEVPPFIRPNNVRMEPRKIKAAEGFQWIVQAFQIFREQPVTWVVMILIYLGIHFGVSMIPILGEFAGFVLAPIFLGGMIMCAYLAHNGHSLGYKEIFRGFESSTAVPLMRVGIIYMLLLMSAFMLTIVFGGGLFAPDEANGLPVIDGGAILALLSVALIFFVVSMAYWFAAALVVFNQMKPMAAMMLSLKAGLLNWNALVMSSLGLTALFIVALIPLGLGLLVWVPVFFICNYTAWLSVFGYGEMD